jgi:hypothetical protein
MSKPANRRLGRYKETTFEDERVRAFIPPPLPPDPPIDIASLLEKLSAADRAVGRLDGISVLLPDRALFLYMYVRKEAVLSSQIEGTQSSMSDLLRFETEAAAGEPIDDIREVSNYVDAMMFGLERLQTLPISLRLLREMHERLLKGVRGQAKNPGAFRHTQNWIGGTRPGNAMYVPPPPDELMACLDAFEKFIHRPTPGLPSLVKAGLLHLQFESIHPFANRCSISASTSNGIAKPITACSRKYASAGRGKPGSNFFSTASSRRRTRLSIRRPGSSICLPGIAPRSPGRIARARRCGFTSRCRRAPF